MPHQTPFPPFTDFLNSLEKEPTSKGLQVFKIKSATDEEAEMMRSYLQTYYQGSTAIHSYMDSDGQIWDCIPIEQQPCLNKAITKSILPTPDYPGDVTVPITNDPFRKNTGKDPFGNNLYCPDGYIPVKRITLEKLVRFKTLSAFNQKLYKSTSLLAADSVADLMIDNVSRKYAYVRQVAPIRGGGCTLSIWQPAVDSTAGQLQSISQIWVAGGSGDQSQTVEVGWEVSPAHWGVAKPVLFIYWTPDNYATGGYNLQGAFVLKNPNFHIGGAINSVSMIDGAQFDFRAEWFAINNAWWLYINQQAVGYYPQSVFGSGPLSKAANTFLTGGEVSSNGTWGPMGSYMYAQSGFGKAAYIRNITIMAMDGSLHDMKMVPFVTAPNCYTFAYGNDPNWRSSIFYGGPGSNNC